MDRPLLHSLVALSLVLLAACSRGKDPAPAEESPRPVPAATPASFRQCPATPARAPSTQPARKKLFVVVLENAAYENALSRPFLAGLARDGALLTNFSAITHPSQPNYFALTAGDTFGKKNELVTLDVPHLGDLVEQAGKSWKTYAEGYPGGCFLGEELGLYARRHLPFLSYANVQRDPARCARVVPHCQLLADIESGELPDFSLYIPDNYNNGHNDGTENGVGTADRWLQTELGPLLRDRSFADDTLFVVTFDENDNSPGNQVYTALLGDSVQAGSTSDLPYDHYSLLRLIESYLGLGSLGRNDATAREITGIWKR